MSRVLRFVKRILPQNLFGRALLIVVVPTVLVQIMAAYVFYARHWENVSRWMAVSLAGEIALLAHEINAATPDRQQELAAFAERLMQIRMTVLPMPEQAGEERFLRSGEAISPLFFYELDRRLNLPFSLELINKQQDLRISVKLEQQLLLIEVSQKRLVSATTEIFIMWLFGSATLFTGIAVLFLRNQIRPIVKLASAMDEFGKGHDEEGFRPQGAQEIKQAGRAFMQMKQRLERQITARMEMLAGISHDLRTPLTRMKLQLEFLKKTDEQTTLELQRDISDMEHMISEYLDFVRGEGEEAAVKQLIVPFLQEVLSRYEGQGHVIPLQVDEGCSGVEIYLRSQAFRRVLTNLVDNALRYGGRKREISIRKRHSHAEIAVEDAGKGIPVSQREEVFKPFKRLDVSRNSQTGGVGLGLTIARDIIHAHGGEISLQDSHLGGLKVLITLPLA